MSFLIVYLLIAFLDSSNSSTLHSRVGMLNSRATFLLVLLVDSFQAAASEVLLVDSFQAAASEVQCVGDALQALYTRTDVSSVAEFPSNLY